MKPVLRWALLLLALVGTLGAVFSDWPGEASPETRSVRRAGPASPPAPHDAARPDPAPTLRLQPTGPNLFAVRQLPPRPAARPVAPPPPTAPPLPFRYQGKVVEQGQVIAFLAEGTRTHIVRAGDRLASYRVEDISPAGMTLVYLPLNEKQQLMFGNQN
jgi:hypothetical protein